MRGQYRVLGEIFIFTVGIILVTMVVSSFQSIQNSINEVLIKDNLNTISGLVVSGIVKVSIENNAIFRMEIPQKISDRTYEMRMDGDVLIISDSEAPELNVTQELFNITKNHNILIIGGRLQSAAKYVEIFQDEQDNIVIKRGLI